MVVLDALRMLGPIHAFASSRRGASARAGTVPGWRAGGHVGETVQCRGLGLPLSAGLGPECRDTFDRSHRRRCRPQAFELIMMSIIVILL